MPWVGLQCEIVVFPDHSHLLLDMAGLMSRLTLVFTGRTCHFVERLVHCHLCFNRHGSHDAITQEHNHSENWTHLRESSSSVA